MNYIKKKEITLLLLLCVICLSSCSTEEYQLNEAGLFTGIWDGFVLLITLIGKYFNIEIQIITTPNTGLEYWVGYFLGVAIFWVGGIFVSNK
jgi:hypothetical protein